MKKKYRYVLVVIIILSVFTLYLNIGCVKTHPKAKLSSPTSKLVPPGGDLQAVLDSGKNLLLKKNGVYEITETLRYKFPNQKISTNDAIHISDFATLRISEPKLMLLVDGGQKNHIVLKNVILDGNRYRYSIVPKKGITGGGGQPPMVVFGGRGADGQKALNNVFMSTRTWSTLKVNGGASNTLIEGNIFLGAGVDPRGNGREEPEVPFNWGDAVSCAAKDTIVRNNLIIDPTDVGIVFYGAPGSIAENNVISCISRESLGGINLVDGFYPLNEDEEKPRYDYRGTIVRNNYIDAFGSRIHIAIPMGPGVWAPKNRHKTLVGATVHGNTIAGGAAAYGLIAGRIDSFSVYDNKSIAKYSGIGEGLNRKLPPDEPGPFIYDPKLTTNCKLQKEFQPCQRHLLHLLRCNHGKTNELGYRIYQYGKHEVRAVINAAYLEMLGRKPSQKEIQQTTAWLQQTPQSTADQLRRNLMKTKEFTKKFGEIDPDDLHPYRISLWMNTLDKVQRDHMKNYKKLPNAKELYLTALSRLNR